MSSLDKVRLGVGSIDLLGYWGGHLSILLCIFIFSLYVSGGCSFPSNKATGNILLTHLHICYPFEFFSRWERMRSFRSYSVGCTWHMEHQPINIARTRLQQ